MKIRQLLESQSAHPFYSELMHVNPQTKQIISLHLSKYNFHCFSVFVKKYCHNYKLSFYFWTYFVNI